MKLLSGFYTWTLALTHTHSLTYAFTYAGMVRERFLKRHQCKVILRKLHSFIPDAVHKILVVFHNFSWGDMKKPQFTPDSTPTTDQRNYSIPRVDW